MSIYHTLEIEQTGNIAYIRFNRPDSLNALNTLLIKDLVECLKEITLKESIKIVVLQGKGKAFSSGGDIKEMLQIHGEEPFFSAMDQINELISTLYNMPKLTIAAIEGAAAGLGLSIALATDYIISDINSKIAMNFIGIGLIPDGGGHFLLKRRIGENKAKQLIWEGKVLSAQEALERELIDEITDNLPEALERKLHQWNAKPLQAMIKTKKIYTELKRQNLLKALELEKQAQWKMRQTKDHQEGIKAFVEKRKPNFIGE
ncbi:MULTISPECIES: enoyl-CoA hydratase [Heyndrickxia]|uniref:Enoyl-CoA hydratase n=1 Tax=Heyndrickxia sporothermodurans TaxID=46224 RepID=A0A150KMS5_9BACI|nr:enoyl-CoA hydratase [Heyndrickxia sporothermodurans]KYC97148.1 Enoyl-CoA hydratase [Heyndrickxia sporothermodurans]MED3651470.1 enoyl-CoA hydratase [Heyndrickxia sporothermodurans]MED3697056.1 enoyl-CoA hydratase [Heyndrickxia sporothermodurans]PTY78419.1 enoyl-CoA hydratase [Heyndrickxia sporothermodurans]